MKSSLQNDRLDRKGNGFAMRALAGSIILHLMVLLAFATTLPEGETAVPRYQIAHFEASLTMPPAAVAVTPAPTFRAPVKKLPVPDKRRESAVIQPLRAIVEPAESAALPVPTVIERAPVVSQPIATVALPLVAAPDVALPDAAGLRQYRLALASEARRYRHYPEAARREGQEGTVEVRIGVADGVRQAELAKSSGFDSLDSAALEMMRQAAARATLPDSLRAQRFVVLLPVVFATED